MNPLIKWIAGAGAARRRYALAGDWSAPGGPCGNCACGNCACCGGTGGTALCAFIPVEEPGELLGLVGVAPMTTRGSPRGSLSE